VIVETPVHLTKRQKELMEEFQTIHEAEGKKQSPKKSSWFDGVKKFVDGFGA
jgi:molecular chaperone DnaJ